MSGEISRVDAGWRVLQGDKPGVTTVPGFRASSAPSAVLVRASRFEIPLTRELDAFSQEGQQLVSGSEPQFSRRINLFYPTFVVLPGRLRVRPQPEDERRSHHRRTIALSSDPAVKVAFKFTFNFRSPGIRFRSPGASA